MPFKECAKVDGHGSGDEIQKHVRPSVGTAEISPQDEEISPPDAGGSALVRHNYG
jgi:hypothetical protein